MVVLLLVLAIGLPLLLVVLTATGLWRRYASAVPWVAFAGVVVVAVPDGTVEWTGVMLGSGLIFDGPSRSAAASCAVLFLALGLVNRGRIIESRGTAVCFLLAWAGVLVQCLAGELLLFLAAAATAGYSMLAFTITASRLDKPLCIAAIVAVLIAGDLALLELATLLVEVHTGSYYTIAAQTLSGIRGQPLVELCIALGLAARLTVPFVVVLWGLASNAALVRTLPGWLALASCSVLASWRLAPGSPGDGLTAPWVAELVWAVPLLPVVLVLPVALRRMLDGLDVVGRLGGAWSRKAAGRLRRPDPTDIAPKLRRIESRLISWPYAMSTLVLLALLLLFAFA